VEALRGKADPPTQESAADHVPEQEESFASRDEPVTGPIRACAAILLVEDDPDVRNNVESLLVCEGYRVLLAENGKRALEILDRFADPVLILADLTMPTMDGWELLQHLRKNDRLMMLPVVIISAGQTAPPGYRLIRKPVRPEELLAIVDSYCVRVSD
jgi:CheY-like chemotaxis protein